MKTIKIPKTEKARKNPLNLSYALQEFCTFRDTEKVQHADYKQKLADVRAEMAAQRLSKYDNYVPNYKTVFILLRPNSKIRIDRQNTEARRIITDHPEPIIVRANYIRLIINRIEEIQKAEEKARKENKDNAMKVASRGLKRELQNATKKHLSQNELEKFVITRIEKEPETIEEDKLRLEYMKFFSNLRGWMSGSPPSPQPVSINMTFKSKYQKKPEKVVQDSKTENVENSKSIPLIPSLPGKK